MLFSGLMDELERAKSHIEGRRFEKESPEHQKCIDILNALTSSLEFETGGGAGAEPFARLMTTAFTD